MPLLKMCLRASITVHLIGILKCRTGVTTDARKMKCKSLGRQTSMKRIART